MSAGMVRDDEGKELFDDQPRNEMYRLNVHGESDPTRSALWNIIL